MTITREQISETGVLRIHSQEGAFVEWEFLNEAGLPDPTPPTVLRLRIEGTPGLSKLLVVTATPSIFSMTVTLAEAQALRAANLVSGELRPKNVRWAVVDETPTVPQVLWEGVVEWDGW